MPVTEDRVMKSLVGSSTTSAGPPALRVAKTLSRAPPVTVTGMPVVLVNCAASACAPGAAEAGVSTVTVAGVTVAAWAAPPISSAAKTKALNRLGIHMQDIHHIFDVAPQHFFHVAPLGDHGG